MTSEFEELMQRYGHTVVPLSEWLGVDIVRMIELMDAELQRRSETASFDYFDSSEIDDYGHDPDLDENGICRICGGYEPE